MTDKTYEIFVVCALIYLVPTIVAYGRLHHNRPAILALNILLGWTILGWIVSLVWSLTATGATFQPTPQFRERIYREPHLFLPRTIDGLSHTISAQSPKRNDWRVAPVVIALTVTVICAALSASYYYSNKTHKDVLLRAPSAGAQISRTNISQLLCPVASDSAEHGGFWLALPCWVVNAYEEKLVSSGYCYKRFSGGNWLWQQCRLSSLPDTENNHAWRDGNSPCVQNCNSAPGYPPLMWSSDNLPCFDKDSNNPQYTLECAVAATLVTRSRQSLYEH